MPKAKKRFNEDRKEKGEWSEKGGYLLTLHLIEITPRQESFMLYWVSPNSGFGDIVGRHFFWMPPRDVIVRVASVKAGSFLCRATCFSLIHCSESLFTGRVVDIVGRGRGRNIWSSSGCHAWHFFFPRVLYAALIIAIICWLIFDTAKQGSRQLISFGGLVLYVLLMFIFSKYPNRVSI